MAVMNLGVEQQQNQKQQQTVAVVAAAAGATTRKRAEQEQGEEEESESKSSRVKVNSFATVVPSYSTTTTTTTATVLPSSFAACPSSSSVVNQPRLGTLPPLLSSVSAEGGGQAKQQSLTTTTTIKPNQQHQQQQENINNNIVYPFTYSLISAACSPCIPYRSETSRTIDTSSSSIFYTVPLPKPKSDLLGTPSILKPSFRQLQEPTRFITALSKAKQATPPNIYTPPLRLLKNINKTSNNNTSILTRRKKTVCSESVTDDQASSSRSTPGTEESGSNYGRQGTEQVAAKYRSSFIATQQQAQENKLKQGSIKMPLRVRMRRDEYYYTDTSSKATQTDDKELTTEKRRKSSSNAASSTTNSGRRSGSSSSKVVVDRSTSPITPISSAQYLKKIEDLEKITGHFVIQRFFTRTDQNFGTWLEQQLAAQQQQQQQSTTTSKSDEESTTTNVVLGVGDDLEDLMDAVPIEILKPKSDETETDDNVPLLKLSSSTANAAAAAADDDDDDSIKPQQETQMSFMNDDNEEIADETQQIMTVPQASSCSSQYLNDLEEQIVEPQQQQQSNNSSITEIVQILDEDNDANKEDGDEGKEEESNAPRISDEPRPTVIDEIDDDVIEDESPQDEIEQVHPPEPQKIQLTVRLETLGEESEFSQSQQQQNQEQELTTPTRDKQCKLSDSVPCEWNLVYMLTCSVHDNFWYFGLSEQEAKKRWTEEVSQILKFRKMRIDFFGRDHEMSEQDRVSFYAYLRDENQLGQYTFMIAHFAEHGCFWNNLQYHGVLGLSNKSDLDLAEAFYQYFGEGTNKDLGGHNMIQETGLGGHGIRVHSNVGAGGEEIPLALKLRMWELADRKMLCFAKFFLHEESIAKLLISLSPRTSTPIVNSTAAPLVVDMLDSSSPLNSTTPAPIDPLESFEKFEAALQKKSDPCLPTKRHTSGKRRSPKIKHSESLPCGNLMFPSLTLELNTITVMSMAGQSQRGEQEGEGDIFPFVSPQLRHIRKSNSVDSCLGTDFSSIKTTSNGSTSGHPLGHEKAGLLENFGLDISQDSHSQALEDLKASIEGEEIISKDSGLGGGSSGRSHNWYGSTDLSSSRQEAAITPVELTSTVTTTTTNQMMMMMSQPSLKEEENGSSSIIEELIFPSTSSSKNNQKSMILVENKSVTSENEIYSADSDSESEIVMSENYHAGRSEEDTEATDADAVADGQNLEDQDDDDNTDVDDDDKDNALLARMELDELRLDMDKPLIRTTCTQTNRSLFSSAWSNGTASSATTTTSTTTNGSATGSYIDLEVISKKLPSGPHIDGHKRTYLPSSSSSLNFVNCSMNFSVKSDESKFKMSVSLPGGGGGGTRINHRDSNHIKTFIGRPSIPRKLQALNAKGVNEKEQHQQKREKDLPSLWAHVRNRLDSKVSLDPPVPSSELPMVRGDGILGESKSNNNTTQGTTGGEGQVRRGRRDRDLDRGHERGYQRPQHQHQQSKVHNDDRIKRSLERLSKLLEF